MTRLELTSKCGLIAGAAMLFSAIAAPVHAQNVPQGSYLQSCRNVQNHGDRLVADCRRTDGSWGRTALGDVGRCVGGIANIDGRLTCNDAERNYRSSRDRDYDQRPGYGSGYDRDYDRRPGYGSSSGYWPPDGSNPGYSR